MGKFPMPLTRMEDIAEDAELAEKIVNDLVEPGRLLRNKCMEAMEQETDGKKTENVKLGKVAVNPKTLIETESLLRPLGKIMPEKSEARKNWRLDMHLKDAHFDVAWGNDEDSKLLVGIYMYGLGSWEAIKSDKSLELGGKILLNASCKPQEKRLDVRAGYLLRSLKKEATKADEPPPAAKKKKSPPPKETKEVNDEEKQFKSKEIVEDDDSSDDEKKKKDKKSKKKDDKSKKKAKSKAPTGPVHIGSSDQLNLKADLDQETFAQCKEKMRAVKKSLKALDKPDPNQTPEEQVANTRRCLVKIGKHIDTIIDNMSEDQSRDWRSSLWLFVSNFTDFDARKLFKLYRHAMKKDPSSQEEKESSQEREEKKDKKEKKKEHKKKEKHKEKNREQRKSTDSDQRPKGDYEKKEKFERTNPVRPERNDYDQQANGDRSRDNYNRNYDRSGFSSHHHQGHHKQSFHKQHDRGQGGFRGGYNNRDNRGYNRDNRGYDKYHKWQGGGYRDGRDDHWRQDRGGHYYNRRDYRDYDENSKSSYSYGEDSRSSVHSEEVRSGSYGREAEPREEGELGPDEVDA